MWNWLHNGGEILSYLSSQQAFLSLWWAYGQTFSNRWITVRVTHTDQNLLQIYCKWAFATDAYVHVLNQSVWHAELKPPNSAAPQKWLCPAIFYLNTQFTQFNDSIIKRFYVNSWPPIPFEVNQYSLEHLGWSFLLFGRRSSWFQILFMQMNKTNNVFWIIFITWHIYKEGFLSKLWIDFNTNDNTLTFSEAVMKECGQHPNNPSQGGPNRVSYNLRSVTMNGHVKYKRNSLACKMQEDSACNTGDSACNFIFLWQTDRRVHLLKSMASGHLKIKRDSSCTYLASHYWECTAFSKTDCQV